VPSPQGWALPHTVLGMALVIPKLPVHVLASGGADSTLLVYLLAQEFPDLQVHVISTWANTKHHAEVTVKAINRLLGTNLIVRSWGKNQPMLIRHAVELVQSVSYGVVYTGCTKNPPVDFGLDQVAERGEPANRLHLRPFFPYHKGAIIAEYKRLGLLPLLSVTRSCGSKTPGRCGVCFFCKERAWSVEVNGIEDQDRTK
jgi:7-cyano-7-deazaguanine synthase in queuosine biosynthesis